MSRVSRLRFLRRDILGMNASGPAAAGSQGDLQFCWLWSLAWSLFVVAGHAVGVDSVLVRFHGEISGRQEGEIDFQLARRPVGHRADVPVVAAAARDHDVFADLRVEQLSSRPTPWAPGGGTPSLPARACNSTDCRPASAAGFRTPRTSPAGGSACPGHGAFEDGRERLLAWRSASRRACSPSAPGTCG